MDQSRLKFLKHFLDINLNFNKNQFDRIKISNTFISDKHTNFYIRSLYLNNFYFKQYKNVNEKRTKIVNSVRINTNKKNTTILYKF